MPESSSAGDRPVPATDEEILDATIGERPQPYATKVVLADYDPAWPSWFDEEEEKIRERLGERARQVEHVGSTSVPGLAAKPVIDIALTVANSSDEPLYVPALERAGYELQIREPDWHAHRVFVTRLDRGHVRDVNLHVFTEGCLEPVRNVVFRDWLRTHDDDRELYEQTKRELAQRNWKYVQNYADAKTDVVLSILARAAAPEGSCPRY